MKHQTHTLRWALGLWLVGLCWVFLGTAAGSEGWQAWWWQAWALDHGYLQLHWLQTAG